MKATFQVYAVDDSRQTIVDIRRAAKRHQLPDVMEAGTEQAGLELVGDFKKGNHAPIFIVDLKLRDSESGFRILTAIRKKRALRYAPVIILTSSGDQESINRSYKLGANSYFIKEDDPATFSQVLDEMLAYWMDGSFHDRALHKKK